MNITLREWGKNLQVSRAEHLNRAGRQPDPTMGAKTVVAAAVAIQVLSKPFAAARRVCSSKQCVQFFSFFSFISLIADGPHHYHPACGHKGSSHLSPVHALQFFLSRCKFSTLTTRQPMVEFYLLTFPRFLLRKKEHKSYFGKNRTHDFRPSRCAAYLLDHSGDERLSATIIL